MYCSSTNIDRIVQIHKAAIKNSRVFVCDDYQNDILQYINLVAKRENLSEVYKVEQDTVCFYKIKIKHDLEEKMKKNGFVMLVKPNKSTKLIMEKIKNSDAIFPIHGEAPEEFYNMGLKNSKIIVLHDGEEFYL